MGEISERFGLKPVGGGGGGGSVAERFGLKPVVGPPPEPLNEQGVTNLERTQINTLGLGPKSIVGWLQKHGYEARDLGGDDYAVRRPGAKDWKKVDPSGPGDWLKDLTIDAGDEYASLLAMGKGAAVGGALASEVPVVGTVGGGIVGAGLAAAGAETARRAAGHLAGFEETPGEFGMGVLKEGAVGATAEVGGKLLGAGLKKAGGALQKLPQALQKPLGVEKAKTALGAEIAAEQGTRATARETGLGTQDLRETLRKARGAETAARTEKATAAMEDNAALMARVAESEGMARKLIKEGRELAGARMTVTGTETAGKATAQAGAIDIPSEIARPDWGVTAAAIRDNPEVGAILRKHFGDEFVPIFQTGEKRGSHAMIQRQHRLHGLIREKGPGWSQTAGTGFVADMAAFMRANPAFTAGLTPEVLAGLERAAAGDVTTETASTVLKTLSMRLTGRAVSPRLAAAIGGLEQATLGRLEADTALKTGGESAGVAAAQGAHQAQMARTARARADYSKIAGPDKPYANFGEQWLNRAGVPRIITNAAPWVGRRLASAAGISAEKLAGKITSATPVATRRTIKKLLEINKTRGETAFRAAVYVALKNGLLPAITE